MNVLCLNSGSSSLKFALFDAAERRAADGVVERIGLSDARLRSRGSERPGRFPTHAEAVQAAFDELERVGAPPPDAIGHRLVHGGPRHHAPQRIDDALVASLRELVRFAPLHLPGGLAGIDAAAQRFPRLPQVACFDTHFHWDLPDVARRLPLPRGLEAEGVRRYGFHGLSYEYLVGKLGPAQLGRAVLAHLGNGASLAAVREGRSIDTTMGLTPAGGIPMGTRSGDLDPGVAVFLLDRGMSARELEELVERRSGLLGVSGLSQDMKTLLESKDPRAGEAVELFCYQARKAVGALATALGGLDTLVFTGGIGERAARVRARICAGLEHLGIWLDQVRNAADADVISSDRSSCTVRVERTDEDLVIARHTRRVLAPG